MPRIELNVDPATCQPQILDDQQLVGTRRLRAELALQLILASSVPINRAFLLGSKHVIQLLREGENEGLYELFHTGNLAIVMEHDAPSLHSWWEQETKNTNEEDNRLRRRLRGLTNDAAFVAHVSEKLEERNFKTVSFNFRQVSERYYELLEKAVNNEYFLSRCFGPRSDPAWRSELRTVLEEYAEARHSIGRDDLYRRLHIPVTIESPEHNYDARQKGLKRVLDACYTANLPLHHGFAYSVTNQQVPLFFYGPEGAQSAMQTSKKWNLEDKLLVSGVPDLSKVRFGTLAEQLNKAEKERSQYLDRIKTLKSERITSNQLLEFLAAMHDYLETLFSRLKMGNSDKSRLCLSVESSGSVDIYSLETWRSDEAEPIHSMLCFSTAGAATYSTHAKSFEDLGNRGGL